MANVIGLLGVTVGLARGPVGGTRDDLQVDPGYRLLRAETLVLSEHRDDWPPMSVSSIAVGCRPTAAERLVG